MSEDWIRLGDRSHPHLMLVDKLKREVHYDGHVIDLRELEQAHFEGGSSFIFQGILDRITERDKMSKGDRSHPNLVRLDQLVKEVSYNGWRDDYATAENVHLSQRLFDWTLKSMERKQKISVGDRSDEDIQFLDSLRLRLSYPNWEKDWQHASDNYLEGYGLNFCGMKFCMEEKQRMHNGDRSHPRLVALDSLQLTYPGWEDDAHEYEERHVGLDLYRFEICREALVNKELETLKRKQSYHVSGKTDSSWLCPHQKAIVESRWTFPGWRDEVDQVLKISNDYILDGKLEWFQVRQMIHDGDYTSHPLLVKLKSMEVSYPGWEQDFDKRQFEINHSLISLSWKYTLEKGMEGMLRKQTVYNGHLKSLEKEQLSEPKEAKEKETGVKECVICWVAPRTHAFVPCGHMCACESCIEKMAGERKICPTCNQTSTMAMKLYYP